MVEKIWNSQSIVSAWEDLYDLVLVRWDKHREWSPWNCVLLTKEESSAHERLETLAEVGRSILSAVSHWLTLLSYVSTHLVIFGHSTSGLFVTIVTIQP